MSETDCHKACHGHEHCQQWSWTTVDSHCYLHSKRCHEDPECVHGTHLLRAFHPQKLTTFEIYSNSTGVSASWTRLRAEPLLTDNVGCDPIDPSTIDSRWRSAFIESYQVFNPDVTSICNSLVTSFDIMPGYQAAVCGDNPCEYKPHDFAACAKQTQTAVPTIPDECESLKTLNWTAYCRYRTSFETFSGRVSFLGGVEGNMSDFCSSSSEVLSDGRDQCPSMGPDWFKGCFSRTTAYEEHCSSDCLGHIENMLSDNGPDDRGLCEKRKEFLNLTTNADGTSTGISEDCDCDLKNVLVTDFCMVQDAYHDNDQINIPELYNSECSTGCIKTLKDSMSRSEWRGWCSDLSEGTIPGVCSNTVCDCDHEDHAGVSGSICELTCPTGISDGEELACSGRNGQCFPQHPEEMIEEINTQMTAGEVRNETKFEGNMVPKWVKGPEPNMIGRCQCAIGSGTACSIPCDKCNNGTYGYDMASQYGICDAYNGICRALPMFMRYNTMYKSESFISYNTTAFESSQGLSKWQYPERFLYENDTTLAELGRNYILDPSGLRTGTIDLPRSLSIDNQQRIKMVLKVWNHICKPSYYDGQYLSNTDSVSYGQLVFNDLPGVRTLKSTPLPKWGRCTPIFIGDTWYLCFFDGSLYAYDTVSRSTFGSNDPGALYVIREGTLPAANEGLSFAIRDSQTIYAYGGRRQYAKTSESFDVLYQIKVERKPWTGTDVVLLSWSIVNSPGERPRPSSNNPMWAFTGQLYILQSDGMYQLTLPSSVSDGSWTKMDAAPVSAVAKQMIGNSTGHLSVQFENNGSLYTFTPDSTEPWSEGGQDFELQPVNIDGSSDTRPINCTMELTNDTISISGNVLVKTDSSAIEVTIYLEEWSKIDTATDRDIINRFMNTIVWRTYKDDFEWSKLNAKDRSEIVDLIERIHMHQARWSITSMMWMKSQIGIVLDMEVAISVPLTIQPSELFLTAFRSVGASFFAQTPLTSPSKFTCSIEGEIYERKLVISANYNTELVFYEQEIEMDSQIMVLVADWSETKLRIRLKQRDGPGVMEWSKNGTYLTWHLIIHLEEWQYSTDTNWTPSMTELPGAFHLYVLPESSPTYQMDYQTSTFLHYSASHCSLSADETCPGFLPYLGLPCSGRGRCNIACRCICEVAKSVLQTNKNALIDIDPTKSPWRGDGCEFACPGYDGYNLDTICSNEGTCQSDGTCLCNNGFTGDACQFECPKTGEEICSSHGGCGTKAFDLSSFNFQNDQYLDTLTATNRQKYSNSLSTFYGSCLSSNFVQQSGTFGPHVTNGSSFVEKLEALKECQRINDNLDLDMTQTENRIYPTGQCVGVAQYGMQHHLAILSSLESQFLNLKTRPVFECLASDCQIIMDEDDDLTIHGLQFHLISPSFEFDIEYVHGYSTGRTAFVINSQPLYIDIDWTQEHLRLIIGSDIYNEDIVIDKQERIDRVKMVVESGTLQFKVYPSLEPTDSEYRIVWIAPQYDVNYVHIREEMSGYFFLTPSEDTGTERTLMTFKVASYECDQEPHCLGLIQWDQVSNPTGEITLYSLYTDIPNLNGWHTLAINAYEDYSYLKKMSLVYQGRETVDSRCAVIKPGKSKYPTVEFTEDYNIPITNIDISLAEDPETETVIVGNGYWTNCWQKISNVTTKSDCYQTAQDKNVYGFSFSEETKVCLVLTGLTDSKNIKLDRFNSESRLTLFHPCNGESTNWKEE